MSKINKTYFKNPPIKEVVCDITFKGKLNNDTLNQLIQQNLLDTVYKIEEKQNMISFNLVPGNPTITQEVGYRLKNLEGNKILDIRPNGISVHRLGKYSNWTEFKKQVFTPLNKFNLTKLVEINHIVLKKVNSFILDSNSNLYEYFNYLPNLKKESNYFSNQDVHIQFDKRINDKTLIFLKISSKKIGDTKLNVIIEIWSNIRLENQKTDEGFLEEILSETNNEMYKIFISTLKKKSLNLIN